MSLQKYLAAGLGPRVLTGIILLAVVFTAWKAGGFPLFLLLLAVCCAGQWELYSLFLPNAELAAKLFGVLLGAGLVAQCRFLPEYSAGLALTASFALLKETQEVDAIEENTVKCHFDPRDTIYDVAERVNNAIEQNRREEADNATLKVAKLLLRPALANTVVFLARALDRYGVLPKYIMEASPFHTSLFITHMGSIGMPAVNHHIYNFGTTSLFLSLGSVERQTVIGSDGKAARKRYLPIGITADERICAGAMYARMVNRMMHYLNNPELLEAPPETVRFEEGNAYGLAATKVSRRLRKKQQQTLAG